MVEEIKGKIEKEGNLEEISTIRIKVVKILAREEIKVKGLLRK
jgi:flagellar motor switch/type III secretory pathway protein FliN